MLAKEGLLDGKTLGVDATTLEANAALRSIVRRDTQERYNEFLTRLAKASGIETPAREDLAKLDKNRPHKGSNEEWVNSHEPDARITKSPNESATRRGEMKDGRTHLAHKAEHAVDLSSGAVVAITLQAADLGDTTTIGVTLQEAQANAALINERGVEEVVADKGYHSNEVLVDLHEEGVRSYIPEPERGSRNWDGKEKEQKRVYGNRRRMSGRRGKDLQKLRTELAERSFAHMYETGGMRRTHLRKRGNILKRLLIHAVGFNLALLVRSKHGMGKPRTLQGVSDRLLIARIALWTLYVLLIRLEANNEGELPLDVWNV